MKKIILCWFKGVVFKMMYVKFFFFIIIFQLWVVAAVPIGFHERFHHGHVDMHVTKTYTSPLTTTTVHKHMKTTQNSTWKPEVVYPWKNPSIKLSPPPATMNKQMGVVNTLGLKPLGFEMDGAIKVFRLIAQPMEKVLTDSVNVNEKIIPKKYSAKHLMHHHKEIKKLKVWGFNGQMPGPTIEANEGDRIRVIFKNELPEPTSIHWHGIELPNKQDGAAGHTQPAVMPGETWTYEFTLYQSGTYLYHSGFNMMKQDHYGLVGLLVIHPKKYDHKIDKQFAIMLQEWAIKPGSEYPDLISMDFNWATFNGLAGPSIPAMTVNQGDRVRIRIGNMSMNSHPIHMHGFTWNVVGTEGGPIPKSAQWPGNTVNVPPGTTRDVEFVAWNPGLWRIHCHKLHHIVNAHTDVPMGIMPHGGMFTLLNVLPKDRKAPWKHPREKGVKL